MATHAVAASRSLAGRSAVTVNSWPGQARTPLAKSLTPPVAWKRRRHAPPLARSSGSCSTGGAYNGKAPGSSSNGSSSAAEHAVASPSCNAARHGSGRSGGDDDSGSSGSSGGSAPQAASVQHGIPAAQQPGQGAPVQPRSPAAQQPGASWLSGRNIALGGSVATVVLLTVFRKEIAPLVKWLVIQTSSLADKSVIGEMSPEAIGTCLAVALTLWWTFAERMKLDSLEAAVEAREAAMEARVAALEQQLAAREAALAARIAALESQAAAGGQAASQQAVMRDAQQWGLQQVQQAEEQQGVLHAQLGSKQAEAREAVQSACGSREGP